MELDICESISRACSLCQFSGGCCFEARPPLCQERIDILMKNGVPANAVEFAGYKRLRIKPDGFCVLFDQGKCSVHSIKPETCVAGPFTFDIKKGVLQIFLKRESICPMVQFLKEDRKVYDGLFKTAVEMITCLIKAVPQSEMAEILKIDEPETDLVAEIAIPDR